MHLSKDNGDSLCEQPSGELLRPGCVQRHVIGHFPLQRFGLYAEGGAVSSLKSRDYKDATDLVVEDCEQHYIVRRLTPLECSRLQGLPDEWCDGLIDENPSEEEMAFWRTVFDTYTTINDKKPKTDNQIRKWLAKEPSDSELYKMYGNGIAVPCGYDVLSKIDEYMEFEEI